VGCVKIEVLPLYMEDEQCTKVAQGCADKESSSNQRSWFHDYGKPSAENTVLESCISSIKEPHLLSEASFSVRH